MGTKDGILYDDDIVPEAKRHIADSAEERLCIRIIEDAVWEIDRYTSGDRRKEEFMLDAIHWVDGSLEGALSFESACSMLNWDASYVRRGILAKLHKSTLAKIQRRIAA